MESNNRLIAERDKTKADSIRRNRRGNKRIRRLRSTSWQRNGKLSIQQRDYHQVNAGARSSPNYQTKIGAATTLVAAREKTIKEREGEIEGQG